ncbi:glutamate cyclase domain-containing protein [Hungatella sp.]|uniref:glutamate cyclase domain-containing protein n=1 Tax=Hungatella sp. TaxID=2613924 RepID=UPI0039951513
MSLERPGKAANGHYHSMRGEVLDDMITDSALFLSEAKIRATTISITTAENEMAWAPYRDG